MLLRSLRFGKEDYFLAFGPDGALSVHPNPKVEGKNLNDTADYPTACTTPASLLNWATRAADSSLTASPRPGSDEPAAKISYSTQFKPYGWVIASGIYVDDVAAIFWQQVWRIGALVAVALLLVIGMSFMLGRSIVKPIVGMTAAMRKISEGDHLNRSARTGSPRRGRCNGAVGAGLQGQHDRGGTPARRTG